MIATWLEGFLAGVVLMTCGVLLAFQLEEVPNIPPVAVAAARDCPECPRGIKGDINCDGVVGFGDIEAFIVALTSDPWGCYWSNADVNCDGLVDFGDINPFVLALADYTPYASRPCKHSGAK